MQVETLADRWVGTGGGVTGATTGLDFGIGDGESGEPDTAARTSFALTQFSTPRISDNGEVDAALRTSDPDVT